MGWFYDNCANIQDTQLWHHLPNKLQHCSLMRMFKYNIIANIFSVSYLAVLSLGIPGLWESMTLFEVDRVFWTRQDKSWQVQKTLSTSKRVMDSFSHPFTIARKNSNCIKCATMLSRCGDSLLTLSPIYCDVIASVRIRESMTSHGHIFFPWVWWRGLAYLISYILWRHN